MDDFFFSFSLLKKETKFKTTADHAAKIFHQENILKACLQTGAQVRFSSAVCCLLLLFDLFVVGFFKKTSNPQLGCASWIWFCVGELRLCW